MASNNQPILAVELAGREFFMKRIPMARVRRLNGVLKSMIERVQKMDVESENGLEVALEELLSFPYELMSLFIKDLPNEIFDDEENGVTFPELLDALKKAVELNRLDTLKNLLTPLVKAALTRRATT